MLGWSLTFFLLAIVSALLGYSGIAGTLAVAAEWLFVVFVVLFILTLIANIIAGKETTPPI